MKSQYNNKAHLTFKREELLYDIKNTAYIIAQTMPEGETRTLLEDICEEGNIDRVTRILDLEVSKCTEILYSFTRHPVGQDELRDNVLKETEVYSINMLVPETFSDTTVTYLEKLIHEYLVYRVLAEWLVFLGSEETRRIEKLYTKADNIKGEVEKSLSARTNKVHIKISPF